MYVIIYIYMYIHTIIYIYTYIYMTNIQTMTVSMEKSGEIFFKCHVKLSQGADITISNFTMGLFLTMHPQLGVVVVGFIRLPPT